jgi:Ca2+-binding RTX toxin-like protein
MDHLESLEGRRLLTASLVGGVLTVTGTPGNDQIKLSRGKTGKFTITHKVVTVSGDTTTIKTLPSQTFSVAAVTSVLIQTDDGNDRVTLTGGKANPYATPTTVDGGAGDDQFTGGTGDDLLIGGDGHDRLSGGLGNDTCRGDAGNDRLSGNDGDDQLFGDAGQDQLTGGNGADLLNGGANDDRFYADDGVSGNDTITGGGWDIPAKVKKTSGDYAIVDFGDVVTNVRRVTNVWPL